MKGISSAERGTSPLRPSKWDSRQYWSFSSTASRREEALSVCRDDVSRDCEISNATDPEKLRSANDKLKTEILSLSDQMGAVIQSLKRKKLENLRQFSQS